MDRKGRNLVRGIGVVGKHREEHEDQKAHEREVGATEGNRDASELKKLSDRKQKRRLW